MKTFLVAVFTFAISISSFAKPNIVHIIADDMGYSDLGCYGGEIDTPHLDSLSEGGLRFTNFYVNNMCWPTRASLLTGLYPKTALPKNGSASGGLHPDATTLPQALRDGGYTTLMSGKWHLSDSKEPQGKNAPQNRGFDQFYGTIDGASDFFAPLVVLNGKDATDEWKDNPDYYYTDAIVDHALDFLKEKPKEKPFYLYLSFTAAHWPLHAKPADIEKYAGRYSMGWDKLREQRHAKMKELGVVNPEWQLSPRDTEVVPWEEAEDKEWQQRRMEVYAAQITSMDENIGRVIDFVKAAGEFENTIFLYHHDNGGCHVEYGEDRTGSWTREFTTDGKKTVIKPGNVPGLMPGPQSTFQSYGYGWANASNTPFRLFKQYDHEGGTRSPLIVSWPAEIGEDRAGGLVSQVSHAVDLMPTLIEAAGLEAVSDQKPLPIEGSSWSIGLTGSFDVIKPSNPLYFWAHNKGRAVRSGKWKLVSIGKKGDWELYDLDKDGTELNDLSEAMPEKVKGLEAQFKAWESRIDLSKKQRR